MTDPWQLDYNKQLNKKIGIKNRDGNVKVNGRRVFIPAGSVMIDDKEKTIFSSTEYKIWKDTGFDRMIYEAKVIFKGQIIDT